MRSHDGNHGESRIPGIEAQLAPVKRRMSERERRLRKELRHRQLAERYDSEALPFCRFNMQLE